MQADHTARREDARRAVAAHELALRDARTRAEQLTAECARLDGEVTALLNRSSETERGSGEARRRLVELETPPPQAAISDADRERLEAALAAARETIGQAQEAERTIAAEIGSSREALASLTAQRDAAFSRREMLDADTVRAEAARESMRRELAELSERIALLEGDLAAARDRVAASDEQLRLRREERDALASAGVESERALREAQERERSTAGRGDAARLRLAEIDAELGMLAAAFAQNPATAAECADVERRYENVEGDVAADVIQLREDLNRLSNVNLNAEGERAELRERAENLKTQLDDLSKARETLLDGVREIERTSQEQFNATFESLSSAFADVFATMFPGGEAKMWQTDPVNRLRPASNSPCGRPARR